MKTKHLKLYIFLLSIFFYSATFGQPTQTDSVGKIQKQTITIASEPDYPPYCIINKDGKPEGFSVDLFLAAAKTMNISVIIKTGVWNQIKQSLADGKIDALPLVGKTPEREEQFDFTLPYLTLHGAVFVLNDYTGIKNKQDIKQLRVAVMMGDNAEEYIRRVNLSEHIITTHTFEEAFTMLANKEVDAVIAQRVMGVELLKKMSFKKIIPLDIQLPDFRQDFCFAVKKGNTELLSSLNEGLSIIIANKTYDKIHTKWFGPNLKENISLVDILRIMLYSSIPISLVFGLIFIISLRKQVKVRTKQLNDEIHDHKKTLKLLRKEQDILSKVEEVAKIGGWEFDLKSNTINWTKGLSRIYEIEPEYKIDTDINFYHPDDQIILRKAIENTIATGEPYVLELQLVLLNGDTKWVKTIGQAETSNGKVICIYESIMDITEMKMINDKLVFEKQRLRQILDNFPLGIYIVDCEYNLEFINTSLINIFGEPNSAKCFEYLHNLNKPCDWCKHNV